MKELFISKSHIISISESVKSLIGGEDYNLLELSEGLTKSVIDDATLLQNIIEKSCISITLPNNITSIGGYAFYNCKSLTSIIIPDSVTNIGRYAFNNCTGLTSVTIPDSVISIDSYAFLNCTGLTSITIPDSVTSIGSNTFQNCTNLLTINVPWAEGEVAGAPWGATNATINYNYTGE